MLGRRFGRLVVISNPDEKYKVLCRCNCGTEKEISKYSLIHGATTSCGCFRRDYLAERYRGEDNKVAAQKILRDYERNAATRNLEFRLTKEQLLELIEQDCHYCGGEPSNEFNWSNYARRDRPFMYNGVDRVDNTKGYVLENCVPCCKYCNSAKNSKSVEEFKEWAKRLYERLYEGET